MSSYYNAYDLTIQDVGTRYFTPDATSPVIASAFNTEIGILVSAYNSYLENPASVNLASAYNTLEGARQALISLASSGLVVGYSYTTVPPTPITAYLNRNMAESLNTLLQLFDVAGFNSVSPGDTTGEQTVAAQWFDLSVAGLGNYLSNAVSAGQTWQSVQAMVGLEYVKAANDLIYTQLGSLQTALNYTQSAVNLLTTLQNIMNAASTGPATYTQGGNNYFIFSDGSNVILGNSDTAFSTTTAPVPNEAVSNGSYTSASAFLSAYQAAGEQAFNNPLPVVATATPTQISQFNALASSTGPLYQVISALLQQYGIASTYTVATAFTNTGAPVSALYSTLNGTLVQSLDQVYSDMQYAKSQAYGAALYFLTQDPNSNQAQVIIQTYGSASGFASALGADFWITDNMGNVYFNPETPSYFAENPGASPFDVQAGEFDPTYSISDYNVGTQGNYSVDLTTAQTAAESLNSQQSQQVQQTLFLFQEFYQSGAGMLTQLNQIIQAMAQSIQTQ